MTEIEKRFNAIPEVDPDKEDLKALARIKKRNDRSEGVSLEEIMLTRAKTEKKYSGKIAVRLPKSLHKSLAQEAEEEGISLNQFILYKLAK